MTAQTKEHALKLLPCPFCGGHAEYDSNCSFREFVSGKISIQVTVYCESCTADITVCVPDVPDITIEQVADVWNRRTESRSELEATIEQLRSELEGEKAAALNYRADAIKAEKQRDELLKGLDRMASKYNRPHKEYFGDEIAQDIASVKSDHFRDSAKMVEGGADTLADIDDSFVGRIDDAITEALGDAMDCTRVWSAWSYGTMGENDFVRVADDQGRVIEIRDAVLRVVSYTKEGGAA